MKINIVKQVIEMPIKIEVDGESYPIHKWNIAIVREYEETKNEEVLKKLKNFSLDL